MVRERYELVVAVWGFEGLWIWRWWEWGVWDGCSTVWCGVWVWEVCFVDCSVGVKFDVVVWVLIFRG